MVDTAGGRATPVDGGLQGGNRQAGVDPSADGVADDPARPGVKDDGDVDEAGRDRDIGNVRHPELVQGRRGPCPWLVWGRTGKANVGTPATNPHPVCSILLQKK